MVGQDANGIRIPRSVELIILKGLMAAPVDMTHGEIFAMPIEAINNLRRIRNGR